jgi:hypothetical protein
VKTFHPEFKNALPPNIPSNKKNIPTISVVFLGGFLVHPSIIYVGGSGENKGQSAGLEFFTKFH